MLIFIMNLQFSFSLKGYKSNLFTTNFLTYKMRLLKMLFQRRIIFIKNPSKFLISTKITFFMSFVQMFFENFIIEKMQITKFTERMH